MLVIVPLVLLKQGCDRGDYECTLVKFPWVSTTMGYYPNDKIYVFLMTLFSGVSFSNYRAYYKRLANVVSPRLN